MDNFSLDLDMGNAEMLTHADVARELRAVADQLEDQCDDSGTIYDPNGNRVGGFAFDQLADKRPVKICPECHWALPVCRCKFGEGV